MSIFYTHSYTLYSSLNFPHRLCKVIVQIEVWIWSDDQCRDRLISSIATKALTWFHCLALLSSATTICPFCPKCPVSPRGRSGCGTQRWCCSIEWSCRAEKATPPVMRPPLEPCRTSPQEKPVWDFWVHTLVFKYSESMTHFCIELHYNELHEIVCWNVLETLLVSHRCIMALTDVAKHVYFCMILENQY